MQQHLQMIVEVEIVTPDVVILIVDILEYWSAVDCQSTVISGLVKSGVSDPSDHCRLPRIPTASCLANDIFAHFIAHIKTFVLFQLLSVLVSSSKRLSTFFCMFLHKDTFAALSAAIPE